MIRAMARTTSIESLLRLALLTLLATLVACSGDSGTSAPVQQEDEGPCVMDGMFVPAGPDRAGIVALVDPPLVGGTSPLAAYLAEDDRVIGIQVEGEYLAVPHNILWSHEIVNLDLPGLPLAVTYSPLSGSSMVFDRRSVGGAEFGVADQMLYNSLVMFNHGADGLAESNWSQMSRTAGCGPFEGQVLAMYPAIEMKWGGWLSLHPDTRVISSDTGSPNDYRSYPYGDYENAFNFLTYFPQEEFDDRYAPKERVLGFRSREGEGWPFLSRSFSPAAVRPWSTSSPRASRPSCSGTATCGPQSHIGRRSMGSSFPSSARAGFQEDASSTRKPGASGPSKGSA